MQGNCGSLLDLEATYSGQMYMLPHNSQNFSKICLPVFCPPL